MHDGTAAEGPRAEKVYEKPGCYAAALWVTNDQGDRDVDFCTVRIYSRSSPQDAIGTLFVTYAPSAEVRVDQPVNFRIWPQGVEPDSIQVDYGDGMILPDYHPYSVITHAFQSPGIHILTVTGSAAGSTMTQRAKIVVQE